MIRGLKNVFNVGDVADFSPYSGNIFFPKGMGVRGSFGRFPHCYVINVPNIFSIWKYMEAHLCSILTRTGGGGASGILSGRPDWFLLDYTRVAVNIADLVLWQAGQHQRGQAYWQK